MTAEQVAGLGPAFSAFLGGFRRFFSRQPTFGHLGTYCRGLLSDLPRKSVEPIALAAGTAVRTLQEFLAQHVWDQDAVLAQLQRRIVTEHLPATGQKPADDVGTVGLVDETSILKKGDKTPGVQRQYCGASGKVDNCIVTVHLAVKHAAFLAILDSDLYLPQESWDLDRARCAEAHIPDDITYRSKWLIAVEQIKRAVGNGVHFDWLTFDEWYGGKPEFLYLLEEMGMNYVAEVPVSFMCWPTLPSCKSLQAPFAAKRVENAANLGQAVPGTEVGNGSVVPPDPGPADLEGQGRPGIPATGWKAHRSHVLADCRPQRRHRRGEVLHLQRPAAYEAADASEGGLLPMERRARLSPGQDRDRLRALSRGGVGWDCSDT